MRRAERLFRLVQQMRARDVIRAEDLAAYLEVSVRTVYRDIAHLQGSGLPIEGEAGVGYILRPGFDLPATTFTHDQLDALAIGLAFVEEAGDASLAHAAREARAKLQSALPDPGMQKLEQTPLFASRKADRPKAGLKIVRDAIRESRTVLLEYIDANENRSERRVRPLAIWAFTDGWLFVGWCEMRADFRAFRLDRVPSIKPTDDHFCPEPSKSLQTYLAMKFFGERYPQSWHPRGGLPMQNS